MCLRLPEQVPRRLFLRIQQSSSFFQGVEHPEEWSQLVKIVFCRCIGDANIPTLIAPFPYGCIIRGGFGDNLIAFDNDLILQNNLTDFLLCGFDIPHPVCGICIKLFAKDIDVLISITDRLSK